MSVSTPVNQRTISRRTLTKGVAWAAPVVAVGAAAPAFAASEPPPTFSYGSACKSPGNSCKEFPKGYEFRFTVCNPGAETIWLYTVTYVAEGTNLTLIHAAPPLPIRIDAQTCRDVVFRADSSNSANQDFLATMTVSWGHTQTAGADPNPHPNVSTTYTVPKTPPDCVCSAVPTGTAAPQQSPDVAPQSAPDATASTTPSDTATQTTPAAPAEPPADPASTAPTTEAPSN